MKKLFVSLILGSMLMTAAVATPAMALEGSGTSGTGDIMDNLNETGIQDSLGTEDNLIELVGKIITFLLGLLGIVLVIYIIYAGFLWMTAGGDSGKVDTAKDMIKNAIIGIIIILAAYGITSFVITTVLNNVTN